MVDEVSKMAAKARQAQSRDGPNSVKLMLLEDGWRLCLERVTERQKQVVGTEVSSKAHLSLLEFRF